MDSQGMKCELVAKRCLPACSYRMLHCEACPGIKLPSFCRAARRASAFLGAPCAWASLLPRPCCTVAGSLSQRCSLARVIVGARRSRKNSGSHIDASHSRQPLVKGERLVRYEVNAVMLLGRQGLPFQAQGAWEMSHRIRSSRSFGPWASAPPSSLRAWAWRGLPSPCWQFRPLGPRTCVL
jgi:hypothetical protein